MIIAPNLKNSPETEALKTAFVSSIKRRTATKSAQGQHIVGHETFLNSTKTLLPHWIQCIVVAKNETTIYTSAKNLYKLIYFFRKHTSILCHTVPDITAIDYPEHSKRFEVVYNLLSTLYNNRIRIKTLTDETTPLPSLTSIFPGAE